MRSLKMIPARTQQNRNGFSLFWPTNDRVPGKKIHGKNFYRKKIYARFFFDFEIFGLKYVLKHSESKPTQKNFWLKF